jgi:molybdenum cofactor cytidylyltransferase
MSDAGQPIRVAAIVLAAGKASRMGECGLHKLLAEFDGVPLIRHSVLQAVSSAASPVVVVTGHRSDEVVACLGGLAVDIIFNPDFADGMASSLKTGLAVLPPDMVDGVMVMLADMPKINIAHLDALISRFVELQGEAVVRAMANGQSGNPVILPTSLFPALSLLEGDKGARMAIEKSGLQVAGVEIGEAALADADTSQAIIAMGGVLRA